MTITLSECQTIIQAEIDSSGDETSSFAEGASQRSSPKSQHDGGDPYLSSSGDNLAPPGPATAFQSINRRGGPTMSSHPTKQPNAGTGAANEPCQSNRDGVSAALEGTPLGVLAEMTRWGGTERASTAVVPLRPTGRTSSHRGSPASEFDSGGVPGRFDSQVHPWGESGRHANPPGGSHPHGLSPHHTEHDLSTPQPDLPVGLGVGSVKQPSVTGSSYAPPWTVPDGLCERARPETPPVNLSPQTAGSPPSVESGQPHGDQHVDTGASLNGTRTDELRLSHNNPAPPADSEFGAGSGQAGSTITCSQLPADDTSLPTTETSGLESAPIGDSVDGGMSFSQAIGATFDQRESGFTWSMSQDQWETFLMGEFETAGWDLDYGPDPMEQPE
jgi:hypothetical protein